MAGKFESMMVKGKETQDARFLDLYIRQAISIVDTDDTGAIRLEK